MIFEAIEDLSTLNYLLQSSPAANVNFESYYCEIIEVILTNCIPQLQQLLRTIVLIRSNHLSIGDKIDSPEALAKFLDDRAINKNAGATPLFKATVSLSAVRSLIRSASHVQQLSTSLFEELLDRTNSIKPSYLFNDSPETEKRRILLNEDIQPPDCPEGCPYKPLKCGNPSWIEEQRVYRALWRLQLYFDLVTITQPSLGITSPECDLLKNEGPRRIWGGLRSSQLHEMDCVYDFLCELSDAISTSSARPPHLPKLPTTETKLVTVPKSIPYRDLESSIWKQTPEALDCRSPGLAAFSRIQRSFHPELQESFKPFRRLGFCIWDNEKMVRLGLIKVPDFGKQPKPSWVGAVKRRWTVSDYWFRWNSLVIEKRENEAGL